MISILLSLPLYILTPTILIGYCLACIGTGLLSLALLARFLKQVERIPPGTFLATSFLLGEGFLASLWLLLALGGWFFPRTVAFFTFTFALSGLFLGRSVFVSFTKQLVSIWKELRSDSWGWQLIAGLTVLLCLMWFTSLGRPLTFDATAFYMALPKFIAYTHRLTPLPGYEAFTNIGLQAEMHYAALMSLHSMESAKLFSWPTIISGGIMLASMGRIAGMGRRGQWLTFSILFSSTAVIWLSGDGKTDLFGAALGLAAYYWAFQFRFNRTKYTLLLIGLFSGFAFVAKLSNIPVIIPGIALLVLWGYLEEIKDKKQWISFLRSFAKDSLVILGGLIIALAPHLIKNGLLFNNPIAPWGSNTMAGLIEQEWYGAEITRRIILTYPFALIYGSYFSQYANLSPLFLVFSPLAFYLPRPRSFFSSPLVVITLASLAGVIIWVILKPSIFAPRYTLATLLLLALLTARAAEHVTSTEQRPRYLTVGIITTTVITSISVLLYCLNSIFFPVTTLRYLQGQIGECERDYVDIYCQAFMAINETASQNERVYLFSYQRYWLRGDLLQCVPSDTEKTKIASLSGNDRWLELYQHGFNYLFFDKYTHPSFLEEMNVTDPPEWVSLTPVFDQSTVVVYRVKFYDPPTDIDPAGCQTYLPQQYGGALTP